MAEIRKRARESRRKKKREGRVKESATIRKINLVPAIYIMEGGGENLPSMNRIIAASAPYMAAIQDHLQPASCKGC
jgi:hypothetical protein